MNTRILVWTVVVHMRISSFWAELVRVTRWHRRGLAAVAAALCVLTTLSALSPQAEPTTAVVVAARTLDGRTPLAADDLVVAQLPSRLAPEGSLDDSSGLVGRLLAAPVPSGAPVTELAVVSGGAAHEKGELLVPVRVQDSSVLAVVRPGDRVTVVAAGQDGNPVTLARRVRVAQVPSVEEGGQGLVLVAAPESVAGRLAAWAGSGHLGLALG